MEIFNEALVLKPAYLKVLLRRALVYKKLKNFDKAIDDLSEVQVLGMKQGQQVTGILECVAELFKEYGIMSCVMSYELSVFFHGSLISKCVLLLYVFQSTKNWKKSAKQEHSTFQKAFMLNTT